MTEKDMKHLQSITQALAEMGIQNVTAELATMEKSTDFMLANPLEILDQLCTRESNTVLSRRLEYRLANAHLKGHNFAISKCVDTDERSYLPDGIVPVLQKLDFIEESRNVAIFGPSNAGKTYLAKALGIQAASIGRCEYFQCNALLEELALLRAADPVKLERRKRALCRLPLLILDDFMLFPIVPADREVLTTLIDRRVESKRSTIVCAQRTPEAWTEIIGDSAIADAIRTRVTRDYTVHIKYQARIL